MHFSNRVRPLPFLLFAGVIYLISLMLGGFAQAAPAKAPSCDRDVDWPTVPEATVDIPTRNKVIVYTNASTGASPKIWGRCWTIQFFGLNGFSDEYLLADHLKATTQVQCPNFKFDYGPETRIERPPLGRPYQGAGCTGTIGMTDVHDIPIPHGIGPIVGVVVDSKSGRKWNLDKVVVDGRTFHFGQPGTDYARRFATHFVFGYRGGDMSLDSRANNGQPFITSIGSARVDYMVNRKVKLKTGNWKYSAARKINTSAYREGELYDGPSRPSDEQTVTVRIKYDGLPTDGRGVELYGPFVDVTLIGKDGKSVATRSAKGLVVNEQFVTFENLPGDFETASVNVELFPKPRYRDKRCQAYSVGYQIVDGKVQVRKTVKGELRQSQISSTICPDPTDGAFATIAEVGVIVEESLEPEQIFQGVAALHEGGPLSARIDRFVDGRMTLADFTTPEGFRIIQAMTPDETFAAMTTTPAEKAAMAFIRSNGNVRFEELPFDAWWLKSTSTELDTFSLLNTIDERMKNAPEQARHGWPSLRMRLEARADQRRNALRYTERLKDFFRDQKDEFDNELANIDGLFGMNTGQTLFKERPVPPAPGDLGLAIAGSAFDLGLSLGGDLLGPLGGPISGLGSLVEIIKLADEAKNASNMPTGFAGQQEIDDTGKQLELSLLLANERNAYLEQHRKMMTSVNILKALVIRDVGLAEEISQLQVDYITHVAGTPGDQDGSSLVGKLAERLLPQREKTIRQYLVRKYLPVRGILYGEPMKNNPHFPKGKRWEQYTYLPRAQACLEQTPRNCDAVLAYSGFLMPMQRDRTRFISAYFHKWQLGFGGQGNEGVKLATDNSVAVRDGFSNTWDYVRTVMSPIDVLNLFASSVPGSLQIKQDNFQCGEGGTWCEIDGSPIRKALPGIRVGSPLVRVQGVVDGVPTYIPYAPRPNNKSLIVDIDWLPGYIIDPKFGGANPENLNPNRNRRFTLQYDYYRYETGKKVTMEAVRPNRWVFLTDA